MSTSDQQRLTENILSKVQAQTKSLSHTLQTNDPPSDPKSKQIPFPLHTIETELARSIPQDLDPIFKATIHDPLESLRATLRGAAFPLRRIPVEILSQIFAECMSDDSDDDEGTLWNTLDVTQAPWTLSQVSRRWREIALGDQKLWSCIKIYSQALALAGKPEHRMRKLAACLARSGEHSLSIHFTDCYPFPIDCKPLFIRLFACAERWTYLKLVVPFEYLELTVPLKGRLPELQTLVIEVDGLNRFGIFDAFEVAPKLREAALTIDDPNPQSSAFFSDVPYVITLPWRQLTSLSIDSFAVIKHTPQLLDCRLWFTSSPYVPTNHSIIHHRNMRTLVTSVPFVLDKLEIPSLESLHVSGDSEAGVVKQIVPFLSRSSCSLSTLVLRHTFSISEVDLRQLLQHVPNLLSLEISHGRVMWNIVTRTLTISNQSCLVPNLEQIIFTLNMTPGDLRGIDPEILLGMLESRYGASSKEDTKHLRGVALLGAHPILLVRLVPRLMRLKHLGLEVTYDTEEFW